MIRHTTLAIALVAVSVAAAGCASAHRASSPACVGNCLWARQGRLDAAADYAKRVAGAVHVLAGVRVDDPANKVILYLTRAPQSVIAKLQAAHPGTYVIRNGAPRTWRQVVALQRSIDWSAWEAKGVHIHQTGPTGTGYLQVGVSSNVQRAQALFDAAYGRGVVRVFHAEPVMAA
jgi:hypothetical protein